MPFANNAVADSSTGFDKISYIQPVGLSKLKDEIMESADRSGGFTELPLQPRAADSPVPLVPMQLRHWKHIAAQGGLSRRICTSPVTILGPLDTDILRKSVAAVAQRHESLRTRIVTVEDVPRQQIDAAWRHDLQVTEVTGTSVAQEAIRIAREFVDEQIDLSAGPLFAAKLLRLSSREHALILVVDHMISDAVSNAIVDKEIWTLYNQAVQGLPFSLPPLTVQFADYALWQERMYGAWLTEHQAYWTARLSDAPSIRIPADEDLVEVESPTTEILDVPLGAELSDRLRDLAQREGASLPIAVLAIYAATMSRWCRQTDLVLAFLTHGRHRHPELKSMVGFLANPLYLRITMAEQDTFLDLLKKSNLEFATAREHEDFGQLAAFLPDCDTELAFNWLPGAWTRRPADRQREAENQLQIQRFPVTYLVPGKFRTLFSETATGVVMNVLYRPDLFGRDAMERLGRNFRSFAEGLAQRPLAAVASAATEEK